MAGAAALGRGFRTQIPSQIRDDRRAVSDGITKTELRNYVWLIVASVMRRAVWTMLATAASGSRP